jgi:GxxExxY protein
MDQDEVVVNQISERIIGCAFRVMNTLGTGFLEKVYENALAHELRTAGLRVTQQQAISVSYNGTNVGDYTADLLVESTVVVELKAVKALDSVRTAQCINYLKASRLRLCLLLNFGKPRLEIQRIAN